MFQNLGEIIILLLKTLAEIKRIPGKIHSILEQLFEMGNASLLMAGLLSLFIGGIMALQIAPQMAERGITGVIGAVIGLAMCKELAPVMMAILVIGRVGSAMTAEIGSMRAYNEIDALETMNISPIRFLVLPRITAICIALPMLTLFSMLVGWIGGLAVSTFNQMSAITMEGYFESLKTNVDASDIFEGLIKSLVFALAIGLIACHQGLVTKGGPRGIGRSVTKSVVNSIVAVLLIDYVVTRIILFI